METRNEYQIANGIPASMTAIEIREAVKSLLLSKVSESSLEEAKKSFLGERANMINFYRAYAPDLMNSKVRPVLDRLLIVETSGGSIAQAKSKGLHGTVWGLAQMQAVRAEIAMGMIANQQWASLNIIEPEHLAYARQKIYGGLENPKWLSATRSLTRQKANGVYQGPYQTWKKTQPSAWSGIDYRRYVDTSNDWKLDAIMGTIGCYGQGRDSGRDRADLQKYPWLANISNIRNSFVTKRVWHVFRAEGSDIDALSLMRHISPYIRTAGGALNSENWRIFKYLAFFLLESVDQIDEL